MSQTKKQKRDIEKIICIILLGNRLKTNSGSVRVDDYKAAFKTWIHGNIINGVGFGNEEAIRNYMSEFRENNKGLSNSLMVILAGPLMVDFKVYSPFAAKLIVMFFAILPAPDVAANRAS